MVLLRNPNSKYSRLNKTKGKGKKLFQKEQCHCFEISLLISKQEKKQKFKFRKTQTYMKINNDGCHLAQKYFRSFYENRLTVKSWHYLNTHKYTFK